MTITDDVLLNYVSNLTTEQYRKLQIQMEKIRWCDVFGHPEEMYYPIFAPLPSKVKGDIWEDMYKVACVHLGAKANGGHDATLSQEIVDKNSLSGKRIEIKYSAITFADSQTTQKKRGWALELGERGKVIQLVEDGTAKGGSGGGFCQVHPTEADYGIFSAVHANGAMHYFLPYKLISRRCGKKSAEPGKIPLSGQHRHATVEGQINLTERFHELFFLDATVGTPFITDLSKYDLSKYENLVF